MYVKTNTNEIRNSILKELSPRKVQPVDKIWVPKEKYDLNMNDLIWEDYHPGSFISRYA